MDVGRHRSQNRVKRKKNVFISFSITELRAVRDLDGYLLRCWGVAEFRAVPPALCERSQAGRLADLID